MGWETNLMVHLRYNRQTYTSRYDVQNRLGDVEDMIKYHTDKIHSIGLMTEPKKFIEEDADPLQWINNEISESLEELEEYYIERFKLNYLLEYWDKCHTKDGEPIHAPEGVGWDDAYIDGDFIMTKEEKSNYRKELGLKDET